MPSVVAPGIAAFARGLDLDLKRWQGLTYVLLGALLTGYFVSLLVGPESGSFASAANWVVVAVELVASALCLQRGFVHRPGRGVAFALGGGLLSWCVGDFVLGLESLGGAKPASPSLADLFYLGFYPLAYIALVLFVRHEAGRLTGASWLDGVIAGLGAAAACAAFAFRGVVSSAGESPGATVVNLAYPVGDLLLLGLVVGATAMLSGRRKAPWLLLAAGMALNAVGDTFNLFDRTLGMSRIGDVFDGIAWPTAIVVMSIAVWLRPRPSNLLAPQRSTGFLLPELAAASAFAILVIGNLHSINRTALGFAVATVVAVGIRLALSARGLRAVSHERHRQSVTDDLTGLGNRRYLFRVLDAFFADQHHGALASRRLAFLFVDLNHFKEINDSFGHPAGDELLRQLGPRLQRVLRESDLAVRLGGDEFAIVLIDPDDDYTNAVAHRVSASIREPFLVGSVKATLSASIGIATAPGDALDSAALVVCADVAMYRAKLSGSEVATFADDLDRRGDRLSLAEELRTGIERGELVLHYQPQLDLRSGEVVSVEALTRWEHPRLGLLQPVSFLPLAEEAGLMLSLTAWVLERALAQGALWRTAGTPVAVSVNVSATNLLDPGFIELVDQLLRRSELAADALVLEITETSVIAEFARSRLVIEELRGLGVVVSIDDFGAGFTSLAYLNNLEVGELKLDRTFIGSLASDERERDRQLVAATIELGHALGLRIVAEGIEDGATLDLLTGFGCDIAQGYFISRPKPAHALSLGASRSLLLASSKSAA